jgi:hypothetical protein
MPHLQVLLDKYSISVYIVMSIDKNNNINKGDCKMNTDNDFVEGVISMTEKKYSFVAGLTENEMEEVRELGRRYGTPYFADIINLAVKDALKYHEQNSIPVYKEGNLPDWAVKLHNDVEDIKAQLSYQDEEEPEEPEFELKKNRKKKTNFRKFRMMF